MNIYQGIPDNSTVTAGQTIHLRFNRKPTTHCADPLNKYPGDKYSVWLYNNPVRNRDTISFDKEIKIVDGIPESAGAVAVKIPKNMPKVNDGSVWYLRVGTSLSTAPQVCPIVCFGSFCITGTDYVDFLDAHSVQCCRAIYYHLCLGGMNSTFLILKPVEAAIPQVLTAPS